MRPNLFLVAAPRSGSTQLAAWLASHPDVGMPPIKEPNFFSQHEFPEEHVSANHLSDVDPERYVREKSRKQLQFAIFRRPEHYAYLFHGIDTAYRMDASTTYLHCPEAPAKIKNYAPDAKIILLTRDPISRAVSHYRLAVRTGRVTRTFREELEAEYRGETPLPGRFLLRQSRYDDAVALYRATWPPEHIFAISFEELIASPQSVLAELARFLDIDPTKFDLGTNSQNAGDAPRFPTVNVWLMRTGTKTWLRQFLPIWLKRAIKRIYFSPTKIRVAKGDIELFEKYAGLKER